MTSSDEAGASEVSDRLVDVAIPVALDRGFTYRVPAELAMPTPGCRVVVPFGPRALIGVVRPVRAERPDKGLRDVLELLDPPDRPALSEELVALCEWIADYYLAPIGESYRLALPGSAMGVDARRVALTSDDRPSPEVAPDVHDRRLLARLAAADAGPSGKPIAVAKLAKLAQTSPRIPAPLARLSDLAARGLVVLDTAEAERRRARTELHLRRTDRLRGGSGDEPAIVAAVGRSKQRRALLDYLELQTPGTWTPISELRGPFPRVKALLGPLLDAGLVIAEDQLRGLDPFAVAMTAATGSRSQPPALTDDQRGALDELRAGLDAHELAAHLLFGITGSGKTEVYLHLIAAAREQGGGAIVLVPEIALTPQLADRFRARFGDEVVVLHSGLSPQQRLDALGHVRAGERPIVIGARSAVFAPVPDLRVIVVDEEHDASFKQDEGVRYNARDVALVRGRKCGAQVVLGSATPSLESWHGVREGRLGLLRLRERPTPRPLPEVEIVDLRQHLPSSDSLLSAKLREALLQTVAAGEQAIVFLNRRGYTTALLCTSCGSFQECPDCSASSMTYHLGRNRLMCHLCGHIEAAPQRCRACGVGQLEHGAAGTERVEVAIAAELPGVRVARLDRDTSRGKALVALLDRFRNHEIDVLIGTQMLAKGHDFPGVTLVGVLRAAQGHAQEDFRSTERRFALLTQVAGRAGRGERPGRVMLQTWKPDDVAIRHARDHDYEGFAERELASRANVGHPPVDNPPLGHAVLVRIQGEDRGEVDARARELGRVVHDLVARAAAGGAVKVGARGPIESPIPRINRRSRMQILIRAAERGALRWILRHLRHALGPRGRGRLSTDARVDVDPYSLM